MEPVHIKQPIRKYHSETKNIYIYKMLQRKTLDYPYQINIIFHIAINCSTSTL